MSFTHLLKRSNGYYYFRIRVPSDLADKIPAREIVKSLKTTDRTNAKTLLRTWQHKTEKAFMLLRADFLSQEQEAELIGKLLLPKQFQITQKAHLRLVAAIDEYIRVIKKGRIMRLFFHSSTVLVSGLVRLKKPLSYCSSSTLPFDSQLTTHSSRYTLQNLHTCNIKWRDITLDREFFLMSCKINAEKY